MKKIFAISLSCALVFSMSFNAMAAMENIKENLVMEKNSEDCVDEIIENGEISNYLNKKMDNGEGYVDNIEESNLYQDLLKEGRSEDAKFLEENVDEMTEVTMYIEVVQDENTECDEYRIFDGESDFERYIEENEIALDNNIYTECSWTGGRTYGKISSNGYMYLTFSSVKLSQNTYQMYIHYNWLKTPVNTYCSNFLIFGHDTNMTVDNDSIFFSATHKRTLITNEVRTQVTEYDNNDSANVDTSEGIKIKFSIGDNGGVLSKKEERYGFLRFKASFVSDSIKSSQLYITYYQAQVSISNNWTNLIRIASNGKIGITGISIGTSYSFNNEFNRK